MSEYGAVPALVDPAVSGITRLSATDTVRARIALAIELGLLEHHEQLPSDAEVAAALDVSEITARRALKSLADDGVLERRRGRTGGTFVAGRADARTVDAVRTYRADAAEVHRLIDRRALIECALVQRAAVNATAASLAELETHVRAGAQAQNWSDYHAADEKFHLAVAASSGIDWALPQYHEVLYALYRYFLPYPVDYLHGANEEHAALVAALRRRDAASAVAIIEHHVRVLHETMFVGLPGSARNSDM
ncbi:MAG: FadR family transcriptional regulator [Microbacteriaceae bacterium]|nr:MAG: FadR family transcriptional regulator [Microbacteriaceae bacterium]